MIAVWTVSLSGWLLVMLLVLAAVGVLATVLMIADEIAWRRSVTARRVAERERRARNVIGERGPELFVPLDRDES